MNSSQDAAQNLHIAYRPDIDGLRAIAILLVIFYHAFPLHCTGGFVGVDVFFIISGFLITNIIIKQKVAGKFTFWGFYKRRIKRIFPALIVVLCATLLLGWWFLLPVRDFQSLGKSVVGSAFFVQNFVMLGEIGYFNIQANLKPLLHIWSLGIEEQFYFFWPVLLLVLLRFKKIRFPGLGSLILLSFIITIICTFFSPDAAFYNPMSRAWELLLGASLSFFIMDQSADVRSQEVFARLKAITSNRLVQEAFSLIAIYLIWYAAFHFSQASPYPSFRALLPVIGSGLLILSRRSFFNRLILSSKPAVFIGLISYPLYLWHYPLLAYAHRLNPDGISTVKLVFILCAVFLLAWLTFRFVEFPIRFGKLKNFPTAPALAAVLFLVGGIGHYADTTGGFPSRIPEEIRGFMLTGYESAQFWRVKECLMEPQQDWHSFAPQCAGEGGRPLLFIWGDSYAAALYSGLNLLKKQWGFDLAEYASSACPPMLNFVLPGREFCKPNNDFTFQKIAELRPDVVILHCTWLHDLKAVERDLPPTVEKLRELGIKRIVLIGPPPHWMYQGLSENVLDYYREYSQVIPVRTKYRLYQDNFDEAMQKIASDVNIVYISVRKVFCNSDGCLARIGEGGKELTAYDGGHLTIAGSVYLNERILPEILGDIKPMGPMETK